jgi:DNA-binding IclR family transcriptional regulator
LGKAYLSSLPEDALQARIDTLVLTAKTDKTITTKDRLLSVLRASKVHGYATSAEEYLPGLLAIGAPLIDPVSGKSVGAVSFDFSVLQHREEEIIDRFAETIVQTATLLSNLLPDGNNHR